MDIDKLTTFYTENSDKLFPIETYPINEDNFDKWIQSSKDEDEKEFRLLFRKYTTHISFNSFYERLQSLCADIEYHIKENKIENVVLIIDQPLDKSNTWISLLIFGILKKYITLIVSSISDPRIFDSDKKTLCIYGDDCSYTGQQLSVFLYSGLNVLKDYPNIQIFLAVPYMSEYAIKKLKKISKELYISDSIYKFKSLRDNLGIVKRRKSANTQQCTIYFDHKLADIISVYQNVYAYGVEGNSLIKGCGIYRKVLEYQTSEDLNKDLKEEMCPLPFYKYVNYTYKGKVVDSNFLNKKN